jgi:hypothetical protein
MKESHIDESFFGKRLSMMQSSVMLGFLGIANFGPLPAYAAEAKAAVEEVVELPPTGIIKVTSLPKYKEFVFDDFKGSVAAKAFRFANPDSIPKG